ncbi:MAG: HAD family phosphatase [Myxococcota bacterium]
MAAFPAAWIFDLDGTLVQTERLKAESYHAALVQVDASISADRVLAHYATVVGRSGEEVARSFFGPFTTPEAVGAALGSEPGEAPWQTLYRVRRSAYAALVEDEAAIQRVACPFNRALLQAIRSEGAPVALATMSHRPQVDRILGILELEGDFDRVATRDDVERGKPDPEIYALVFDELGLPPGQSVIIEDSPSGARAAIASGAHVLVVVNDVTRDAIARADLPPDRVEVLESDATLVAKVRAWRATAAR